MSPGDRVRLKIIGDNQSTVSGSADFHITKLDIWRQSRGGRPEDLVLQRRGKSEFVTSNSSAIHEMFVAPESILTFLNGGCRKVNPMPLQRHCGFDPSGQDRIRVSRAQIGYIERCCGSGKSLIECTRGERLVCESPQSAAAAFATVSR